MKCYLESSKVGFQFVYKTKKSLRCGETFSLYLVDNYLLTVLAKSEPALNLATFLAAILIAFPV